MVPGSILGGLVAGSPNAFPPSTTCRWVRTGTIASDRFFAGPSTFSLDIFASLLLNSLFAGVIDARTTLPLFKNISPVVAVGFSNIVTSQRPNFLTRTIKTSWGDNIFGQVRQYLPVRISIGYWQYAKKHTRE